MATKIERQNGRSINLRTVSTFIDTFLVTLLLLSIPMLFLLFVVEPLARLGGLLIVFTLIAALLLAILQSIDF